MLLLYNIAIQLYGLIIKIFSLFNNKAKLFVQGRRNIFENIQKKVDPAKSNIWFHFASLGEFEQGRPLLEKIKSTYPEKQIILLFSLHPDMRSEKTTPWLTEYFTYHLTPQITPNNLLQL